MRFDNAFLTKSKLVGIQLYLNGELVTVYREKNFKIIFSDNVKEEQKEQVREFYLRHEKKYMPKLH